MKLRNRLRDFFTPPPNKSSFIFVFLPQWLKHYHETLQTKSRHWHVAADVYRDNDSTSVSDKEGVSLLHDS